MRPAACGRSETLATGGLRLQADVDCSTNWSSNRGKAATQATWSIIHRDRTPEGDTEASNFVGCSAETQRKALVRFVAIGR